MRLTIVSLLGVGAIALVFVPFTASQAQTPNANATYPTMAPVEQYLMADRLEEIALARTAAPAAISRDAEILVLGRHGYETAVKGKNGFGGELGHVLIPYQSIAGTGEMRPECNCGRIGDLESLCSLTAIEKNILPYFLPRYTGHELAKLDLHSAAKLVRGLADRGDPL